MNDHEYAEFVSYFFECYAPPRPPMLLPEAESLIAKLLRNWLRSKQR
jgi:hypothetical protein